MGEEAILMKTLSLALLAAAPFATAGPGALLHQVPLTFEPNVGQSNTAAPFVARGEGYQMHFAPSQVEIRLGGEVVRMRFRNNAGMDWIEGVNRLPNKANYIRGAQQEWRTGVDQYESLRYRGLYDGIDLVFYGQQRQFEYDFVVHPGADPKAIDIEFEGARLAIGPGGELDLFTASGKLVHHAPVIYQERDGRRIAITGRYRLTARNRAAFEIGAYDRSLPLVIDPVMQYSSYIGGKAPNGTDDIAYATALDQDGNIYIAGRSASSDFPLQGAMQTANKGSGDAFVIKLDPAGKKVLYSTYIGGRGLEYAYALTVDQFGQAHITGTTGSADFPVNNAFQSKHTGLNNVFVVKLNAQGNGMVFSTFMGGERNDVGHGIALDPFGNVFIAGTTNSLQFPTLNAMQAKAGGGGDGMVAKFAPDGKLLFSTFLGGQSGDEIFALAVDGSGNAYVTGTSSSANLATSNAAQPRLSARDAFVAKLISNGSALAYFTYLGGNGIDEGHAITVDAGGNAYVAGYTGSRNFPATVGVVQDKMAGNSDAFLTKTNETGTAFVWSTFLGGTGVSPAVDDEVINSIVIDPDGCVYVTGTTVSADFPTNRATQATHGGRRDVFLTKLTAAADKLIFSTFVGGADRDEANGLVISPLRAMFVTGQTFSTNYPVAQALSDSRGANSDGFLTRVCDPVMFISTGVFAFAWVQGTDMPSAQNLIVSACRDLSLAVTVDADWLTATPAAPKDGLTAVSMGVKPEALEPGDYTATVTVSNPDVWFGPSTAQVILRVVPPPPPGNNR